MKPWRSVAYIWLVVLAYCLILAAAMIFSGATFRGLTLQYIEQTNYALFRQLGGWTYFCLYFLSTALIAVLRWRQKKKQLNEPKIQSIDSN
jgi:hypothetical protein